MLCSGKVYYDLIEDAAKRKVEDVAIVRVEQLYPFPRKEVGAELAKYPAAKEIVWCQEEPMNQGAWYQIRHHLAGSPVAETVAELRRTHALAGAGLRTSGDARRRTGRAGRAGARRSRRNGLRRRVIVVPVRG